MQLKGEITYIDDNIIDLSKYRETKPEYFLADNKGLSEESVDEFINVLLECSLNHTFCVWLRGEYEKGIDNTVSGFFCGHVFCGTDNSY